MDSRLQKRGEQPLTLLYLLASLHSYKGSYQTLLFAQQLVGDNIRKALKDSEYNYSFNLYKGNIWDMEKGIIDESKYEVRDLQGHLLRNVLKLPLNKYAKSTEDGKVDFEISDDQIDTLVLGLSLENAHFLRTRFINSLYEALEKYIIKFSLLTGFKDDKKCTLRLELQQQDWYIMLYLLRNQASHFDGMQTPVLFRGWIKHLNKKVFTWRNIEVTEGMDGHSIRYDDNELLELSQEIEDYINKCLDSFVKDSSGRIIPELADGIPITNTAIMFI